MSLVKRVYVEKKSGFDVEAREIRDDLRTNVGMKGLQSVRVVNRYDVEGVADDAFAQCVNTVFAEPPVDTVYENDFPRGENDYIFAVKYLPGQYDQRADSAAQCIQIVTGGEAPVVECARVYICAGDLSEDDCLQIQRYCVNPVDSMVTGLDMPKTLVQVMPVPEDIKSFDGFIAMTEDEVQAMRAELGLAMSDADLLFCQGYFRDTEKRDPTVTEIRVIDTYWSDHCRHTTFLTKIENVTIDGGFYHEPIAEAYKLYLDTREKLYVGKTKDICLMDMAVMGMKALRAQGLLADLDESEEINACSIVVPVDVDGVDEDWLIMFKNETHNHPTEIEPFGGASTCLGGAIRDPLSGRSYVYQAMRVTGSGDPRTPVSETVAGKLPQRQITQGAAAGYSSYGNQIGLATGQVTEIYDEGYVAKRMEIGAVIGAAKKEHVVRERPVEGDVIILVGGRTGRDGCGGATGSSKEHTEDSIDTCGAEVQKGNPPTERKLQRLFRNPKVSKMIKRCNDFGAGGVSVAIGELSDGLVISLDAVPKKYEGLDGTELAISESQERMAVVVTAADVDAFIAESLAENLEAVKVADVTDDRRLVMNWRGTSIVNIARDFLDTNGATQTTDAAIAMPADDQRPPMREAESAAILENLRQLNVAAQKGLSERFGSTIGAGTVLMPFGGANQLTPAETMAAKVPVLTGETTTATVMAFGYNPEIAKWSPFHGAMLAVVESVAKLVASGARADNARLTFQEYFERLGTDAYRWGKPMAALLGAFTAQMELGVPSIGGKDSMSGTFMDMDVPPTLVSFAVNTEKMQNIISPEFKKAGSLLVKVTTAYDEKNIPDFAQLKAHFAAIHALILQGHVISAHTIGFGGAAAAICKMAFGNDIGAEVKLADDVFAPQYGSFILEVNGFAEDVPAFFQGCAYEIIGQTAKGNIVINGTSVSLAEAKEAWLSPLESVFPTGLLDLVVPADIDVPLYTPAAPTVAKNSFAKPRVLIPVFPGSNCEYDTKIAFERAGAAADIFVMRNLTVDMLAESIAELSAKIEQSQMIMIPGGFSAGDEPEGSGKFIAAMFRNPAVTEATMELIKNRDGLMLGICNGFQALIKLGLVPYGEIRDMTDDSPTLTFNTIGRHISMMARTKLVSKLSPWFANLKAGDIHSISCTHCEGRFAASDAVIDSLVANGQIATQYVDFEGKAANAIQFNPNGSMRAIEGITSPDGRILGKMGHSERIGRGLYKNIPGEKDQKLFEAGVGYFK